MIPKTTPKANSNSECICISSIQPDFEQVQSYLEDESRYHSGEIQEVCLPFSESQIVKILKDAHAKGNPVTISAGRTGIVGGAVPESGILLSLEKLNKILSVGKDENNWILTCEPGISLKEIDEGLRKGDLNIEDNDCKDVDVFLNESSSWFYPPDPTEKTAHLGGTVATNASGAHSFKYGPTRPHVMALRVVLADGTLLQLKRGEHVLAKGEFFEIDTESDIVKLPVPNYVYPPIKNTAGYFSHDPMDLIDFFIGSEGTLGIITEVSIALTKRPESILGCLVFFESDERAYQFVEDVKQHASDNSSLISPAAIEYFGPNAIQLIKDNAGNDLKMNLSNNTQIAIYFEQEFKEEEMDPIYIEYDELLSQHGIPLDEAWAAMEPHELKQMADFRHLIPETVNMIIGQRQNKIPDLHKISTDFVVKDGDLYPFIKDIRSRLENNHLEYVIFGHIGENHLHVNIIPNSEDELKLAKKFYGEFAERVVSLGGSISGEHGIGKIKKHLLSMAFSESAYTEMQEIKQLLDPKHILNSGVIF